MEVLFQGKDLLLLAYSDTEITRFEYPLHILVYKSEVGRADAKSNGLCFMRSKRNLLEGT